MLQVGKMGPVMMGKKSGRFSSLSSEPVHKLKKRKSKTKHKIETIQGQGQGLYTQLKCTTMSMPISMSSTIYI